MIETLIKSDGMSASGRKYTKEALEKMVEQYRDMLVFCGPVSRELRLIDAVGRVEILSLAEGGALLAEIEPINERGEFLMQALEQGKAKIYTIGIANPVEVDGVQTVGADYQLKGIGIEMTQHRACQECGIKHKPGKNSCCSK